MIRFAALMQRLAHAPDAAAQQAWLARERAQAPETAALALELLEGRRALPRLGVATLRGWAAARCVAEEVALCRAAGASLTEALALLWPAPLGSAPLGSMGAEAPPDLAEVLAGAGEWTQRLPGWLDRAGPEERLALLRLATGRLPRLLVAPEAAQEGGRRARAMLTYVVRERGGVRLGFALRAGGDWLSAGRAEAGEAVLAEVSAWMGAHTQARTGPVVEVEPGLVLVLDYLRAESSGRYRAGLVLRGARAVATGGEADGVEDFTGI